MKNEFQFNIEEYCYGCLTPNFEIVDQKFYADNEPYSLVHSIQCENRYKCKAMYDYLKGELQNGDVQE